MDAAGERARPASHVAAAGFSKNRARNFGSVASLPIVRWTHCWLIAAAFTVRAARSAPRKGDDVRVGAQAGLELANGGRAKVAARAADLVLTLEVRNARLSIGGTDRGEDEMYACGLGRVRGGDTLSRLGLRASFEWG